MTIEVFDCEQGSDQWKTLRVGIPTASNFSKVMATGEGKVRSEYLRRLAGEVVTGIPTETYKSAAMEIGTVMEPELRALYAMMANVELRQVGFIKRTESFGIIGCSPDSLIGDDGGVEFKKEAPHILIKTLKDDRVPSDYLPQIQGNMLVTGRPWWDIAIGYSFVGDRPDDRQMPLFRRRVRRDESAIARLRVGLEVFQQELDELVAWLRRYGKD